MNGWPYQAAADAVLLLHLGFVSFVIGGTLVVWAGRWAGWRFVRNRHFRWLHLGAMGLVLAQSLLGLICPLTRWENWLRSRAGEGPRYRGTFIEYWVGRLIYYELSPTVFAVAYGAFFALVVTTWWLVPPRRRGR